MTFIQNRRRAAAWGTALSYLTTAFTIVRNVLLVPLYLRFIPLIEYGAWLATGAALVQMLVSDFGLAGVLLQKASSLLGARDIRRLGQVISSGLLASLGLALVLTTATGIIITLLPAMRGLTAVQSVTAQNCFFLAVIASGVGILAGTCFSLARSFQQSVIPGLAVLIGELAFIATAVALLFVHCGLYSIAVGLVARSTVSAALLLSYLLIVCRRRWALHLRPSWRETRTLFSDSWTSFFSSLAMKLQSQSNTFLIGLIIDPAAAAIYALTVRVHDTIAMLLGQFNGALVPSLAHLQGFGDSLRFKAVILRLLPLIALFTTTAVTVTLCVNMQFVALWVGSSKFGGQAVSLATGAAVWLTAICGVAYDALYASGRFKTIASTFVLTALTHVALLATVLRFGLWTAPVVTLVTTSIWGLVFWIKLAVEIRVDRRDLSVATHTLPILAVIAVVTVLGYLYCAPRAASWGYLAISTVSTALLVVAASLSFSASLRRIVLEEGRATYLSVLGR
jgi:O-antigen/teichoic acid export membrane protein